MFWREAARAEDRPKPIKADDEHTPAPEIVGDPPSEQEEASEGERVGAHDPLAVRDRDVQGTLSRRQGHDDH